MAIIYKFTGKSSKKDDYSDTFLKEVDLNKVTDFLRAENPNLPEKILVSMANAIVASTHLQLLLDEHGIVIPSSVYETFEDHEINYLDYGSKTLH
jgi:hypothetical protein